MTPQQQAATEAAGFVAKLNDIILFPLITLLTAIAFLFLIYGGAKFILNANNETARAEGRKTLLYGFIGLVVMLSAYTILSLAAGTFGLDDELDCANSGTC